MSEEDSYLDNDQMKGGRAVDKESLEYKKRREKNNEAVSYHIIIIIIIIF